MQVVRAIVHVEEVIRMHNVKSVRFRSFLVRLFLFLDRIRTSVSVGNPSPYYNVFTNNDLNGLVKLNK